MTREEFLSRVEARKTALTDKDTLLGQLQADISALLAPLDKLGALLPDGVKAILAKYKQ